MPFCVPWAANTCGRSSAQLANLALLPFFVLASAPAVAHGHVLPPNKGQTVVSANLFCRRPATWKLRIPSCAAQSCCVHPVFCMYKLPKGGARPYHGSNFQPLCRTLLCQMCVVSHLAQAYLSGVEFQAAAQLRQLSEQYPSGTRVGIRCIAPVVVDSNGHVPNLLQNLLLRMYAGFPLVSELDRAVRNNNSWPASLPHLLTLHAQPSPEVPGQPTTTGVEHVRNPTVLQNDESRTYDCSYIFSTHLHQHSCVQRRSA